ncbi:hypothetical protein [Thalassococcus sp. S3]|uniref:hypothetical protein n=1 Tax=Thalassococcus sp. S3 TaxID=2017482 RepID=UPI0010241B50|nr:hypothetical protein [Thalassococcus sp. S3]QBF32563.1 hypothetical protein CFI11_15250 [Thalassococcus sp. S3]
MTPGGPSVFLERQSYRRRRLLDAARFLPVLGALLFAFPLLWPKPETGEAVSMSSAMLYVFGVWAVLIGLAACFGLAQRRWSRAPVDPQGE